MLFNMEGNCIKLTCLFPYPESRYSKRASIEFTLHSKRITPERLWWVSEHTKELFPIPIGPFLFIHCIWFWTPAIGIWHWHSCCLEILLPPRVLYPWFEQHNLKDTIKEIKGLTWKQNGRGTVKEIMGLQKKCNILSMFLVCSNIPRQNICSVFAL